MIGHWRAADLVRRLVDPGTTALMRARPIRLPGLRIDSRKTSIDMMRGQHFGGVYLALVGGVVDEPQMQSVRPQPVIARRAVPYGDRVRGAQVSG